MVDSIVLFIAELCYADVFLVWESIWAAKHVCSDSFVSFVGLAMIEAYREIILDNSMDFIDVMKFFNGETAKPDICTRVFIRLTYDTSSQPFCSFQKF